MKVLLAHNRYRVPGGEERHVDLLEQGLTAAGVEVRRFERNSAGIDGSAARRAAAGLTVAYRPGGGGIARAIDDWRPDVVHFHNLWPLLTPAALRIAKRRGAKVVLTVHNYRFACPGGTLLRDGVAHDHCLDGSSLACAVRNPRGSLVESLGYGMALELHRRLRLLSRWVDVFVAPGEFVRDAMVRAGLPEERIVVVRHGVAVETGQSTNRQPRQTLLFAGRLAPEKGVDVLIRAARQVSELPVVIAGTGPLLDELKALAPPSVSFAGWLGPSELAALRSRCLMTVLPSVFYEISPFGAIESAADGRGVIASRIGGLPEIVRDGVSGILVDPGDPDDLVRAMRVVHDDPDRAVRIGASARALAAQEFELGRQTRRLLDVYAEAA
jgi:glycosyltransferase involved in cell wall biosynthesis